MHKLQFKSIKKNHEFRVIYSNPDSKFFVHYLTLLVKKNNENRFGIVISSKIGNAVIRNKIKRQIKSIGREILPLLKGSNDYVIIAKKGIKDISFQEIRNNIMYSFGKLKLIRYNP